MSRRDQQSSTPGPATPTHGSTGTYGPGSASSGSSTSGGVRNEIVGGFALTYPSMVGGYGPYRPGPTSGFDPYRNGDMRRILNGIVTQDAIYDLQLALIQGGFLSGTFDDGIIDDATRDAFATVLTYANQHGVPWQDILSQAAAGGGIGGGMGSGGAALSPEIVTLPNREDLIERFEIDGMSLTGERLDEDLRESAAESVLDALRTQQERQVQREMDLSGTGEGIAFVESAPDLGRLVEEEIRTRAPQKVMNKQTRDAMEVWFEMIGEPL